MPLELRAEATACSTQLSPKAAETSPCPRPFTGTPARRTGTHRGGLDDEYNAIYQQYKWGGISEAEAKAQMTAVAAREPDESGTRSTTRAEAFAEYYAERWDAGERTDD
jgi:hypothetical protein